MLDSGSPFGWRYGQAMTIGADGAASPLAVPGASASRWPISFPERGGRMLKGKKVIALGERDGVQGGAIAACARSAGAEVVLEKTYCFV